MKYCQVMIRKQKAQYLAINVSINIFLQGDQKKLYIFQRPI